MKIDFNAFEEKHHDRFKGGEGVFHQRMVEDDACKIMRGMLQAGSSLGEHTHEGDYEVVYIVSGAATMIFDGVPEELSAGDCSYCPEGHTHRLMNTGDEDLIFFAVVSKTAGM